MRVINGKTYLIGVGGAGAIVNAPIMIGLTEVNVKTDTLQYSYFSTYRVTSPQIVWSLCTAVDQQNNLYIAGVEGSNSDAYIFVKKIKDRKEIGYKRYGAKLPHMLTDMAALPNGYIMLCGSIYDYYGNRKNQGFYLILDAEGELVGTNDSALQEVNNLQLSPNPATQYLTILNDFDDTKPTILQVMDMQGRVLINRQITVNDLKNIDISALAAGNYCITLQQRDKLYQGIFVKQ
jgi:Secretion system C-terminal sorting domain